MTKEFFVVQTPMSLIIENVSLILIFFIENLSKFLLTEVDDANDKPIFGSFGSVTQRPFVWKSKPIFSPFFRIQK